MILKKTLIATISALLLCGCANSYLGFGSKGDVDPALEESGAKFFSESGFTSCLAGAGIGVAACAAADSDNMLACMLIAGFSGCAVGMTTNYVFDSVRSNYAKTEDQLDAIEKMVSQDVDAIKDVNKAASDLIEKDNHEIDSLISKTNKTQKDKEAINKKLLDVDANIAYINEQLKGIDEKVKSYEYARKQYYEKVNDDLTHDDKAKLDEIDANIAILKNERDSLYAMSENYSLERKRLAHG